MTEDGSAMELKLLSKDDGSDSQGESSCSEEYGFCVREDCISGPPRPISRWSFFQFFAQMVCAYTLCMNKLCNCGHLKANNCS